MLAGIKIFARLLRQWRRDRRGIATVEAAMIAPIFILGGLAVFDLGLAGTKRLELDQALRAGAQVSMINVTREDDIMQATLAALGEAAPGEFLEDGICEPNASCVDVSYACSCEGGGSSACDQLCIPSGEIPSAFLTIVASRRHDGFLFPDMDLQTQIVVQTR